ncbi:MAG: hypothetical protein K2P08_02355 [Oscillospiraceae bacterium]|nr:hypothetical protein [Oscillospiraceae bacterium]
MRTGTKILRVLLAPLAVAAALLCFTAAVDSLEDGQSAQRLQQVEQAVRRSCVSCYALEGTYPPDLDYLKDRYGLQIDEEEYIVRYSAVAQNLMPDIHVLPVPREGGEG